MQSHFVIFNCHFRVHMPVQRARFWHQTAPSLHHAFESSAENSPRIPAVSAAATTCFWTGQFSHVTACNPILCFPVDQHFSIRVLSNLNEAGVLCQKQYCDHVDIKNENR